MFRVLRRAGILPLATLAALTTSGCPACDPPTAVDFTNTSVPAAPIAVTITPAVQEASVGRTATFVAQVTGGSDTTDRSVSWTLEPAEGVVTLTASGTTATVRGVRSGDARVIATHASGATAEAQVRVFGG